jgi:Uncharacterised protein family (UPF0014)
MNSYISLTYGDLLLASIFLAMNAVFSILLSLQLERQLIVSALRMITQLFLVGLVLKTIFTLSSLWLTLLVAAVMVAFAGREIWARQDRRLHGVWGIGLGGTSMLLAGSIVTVFALTTQIQPTPWWSPQFALPLFGMILGNTMTGVSLGLDTLHTALYRERTAIAPARPPQRLYADHQLHGGDRCRLSPGDDDGPDPVRCRPAGGRQVPDPDHPAHRRSDGPGCSCGDLRKCLEVDGRPRTSTA